MARKINAVGSDVSLSPAEEAAALRARLAALEAIPGESIPATVAAVGAAQRAAGGPALTPTVKREPLSVPAPSGKANRMVPTVEALNLAFPGGYRVLVVGLAGDGGETVLFTRDGAADKFNSGSWGVGINGARVSFNTPGGPASLCVNCNLTQADSKPKA